MREMWEVRTKRNAPLKQAMRTRGSMARRNSVSQEKRQAGGLRAGRRPLRAAGHVASCRWSQPGVSLETSRASCASAFRTSRPGELQDPGRPRLSSSFGPWGHTVDSMRTCSQGLRQRWPDGEAQSKMSVSNGTRW